MPMNKIFTVLRQLPPEVLGFVLDLVRSLAGATSREQAARRAITVASRAASDEILREALKDAARPMDTKS
jgi:hypothetical protein